MKKHLYLFRHGETLPNGDLNEKGMETARDVAERFKNAGVKPEVMYAGQYGRQYQTARIVADAFGLNGIKRMDPRDGLDPIVQSEFMAEVIAICLSAPDIMIQLLKTESQKIRGNGNGRGRITENTIGFGSIYHILKETDYIDDIR
jgi:hypothetical protein